MKSSTGAHYLALDHVRALAAFMVFTWHFVHGTNGTPVSFEGVPSIFPLALLDEGHTGVALFMVLSGYLFAKLLDGKDISFTGFFWNRFIRLAPLLIIVFALVGIFTVRHGDPLDQYIKSLAIGLVAPRWPNGGWSIAIEVQFYLMLWFVLAATRHCKPAPIIAVVMMIAIRSTLFECGADMRFYSYATMAGRADDFLLGIAAFNYRHLFRDRHLVAGVVAIAFCALGYLFDAVGGYYLMAPQWPWIFIPTIEAAAYAMLIGYYDSSFQPANVGLSNLLAQIGTYSYSIYLLHFFIVFRVASFINDRVLDISNFYVACLASTVIFCGMIPIGWLSYRCIERPALSLRRPYLKPATKLAASSGSEPVIS